MWRSPAPERGSGASCSFLSRFFEQPIRILRGLVGASYLNSRWQRRILFLEPGPWQIRRQRRVTQYGHARISPKPSREGSQTTSDSPVSPKSARLPPRPVKT